LNFKDAIIWYFHYIIEKNASKAGVQFMRTLKMIRACRLIVNLGVCEMFVKFCLFSEA